MSHVLIDMRTYQIVYKTDDEAKAEEAKSVAAPPTFLTAVPGDWDGFTGPDLVRFWNALPHVTRVGKFETRGVGVKRINAELAKYEGLPPYAESAATAPTVVDTTQETPIMSKPKVPRGRKPAKEDAALTVTITAEGKKGTHFKNGSMRGKVFATLERTDSGTLTVAELVKRCAFAKRPVVMACVQKLVANKLVKIG